MTFSLATNEHFKPRDSDESEWRTKVSWHNVKVFKPSLVNTLSNYVQSGDRVLVQGKLNYRSYEDEETGKKIRNADIIAEDLVCLSKRDL